MKQCSDGPYLPVFFLESGVVFNDVYTASKFAMEGFCESMAVQLMKFNIRQINLFPLSYLHICLHFLTIHAHSQTALYVTCLRLSMIEPGPVHTEFETKMMEDVAKMEYPGVDADTVRYFKDVYLPSSIDIFEAMGQTPEDIAKVRELVLNSYLIQSM